MTKKIIKLFLSLLLLTQISVVSAGDLKTITLAVDGMTCSMCPITVKKSLQKVEGVSEVVSQYEGEGNGWTRVTYDTDKVNVADLITATEQAGFPSKLKP